MRTFIKSSEIQLTPLAHLNQNVKTQNHKWVSWLKQNVNIDIVKSRKEFIGEKAEKTLKLRINQEFGFFGLAMGLVDLVVSLSILWLNCESHFRRSLVCS